MLRKYWQNYLSLIDIKKDIHGVFFRTHNRYAVLDGARAITILLMVLFHCVYGVVRLFGDKIDIFIQSYPDAFDWTWQIQGSDPLFVMCGLLVSYSLFRENNKNNSINLERFYKNRLMRIMPLFLFALLIYFPFDDDNLDSLLANLFFVTNFFPETQQIIPVGWSLSVQVQFYILLPFIVMLMFRFKWRIPFLLALIFLAFLLRYLVVKGDPVTYEYSFYNILYDEDFARLLSDALYYDLEDRIGSFLIGVLVAYLHIFHGEQITDFFKKHFLLNTLCLVVALLMILVPLCIPVHDKTSFYYEDFSQQTSFWYLVLNRYVYSLGIGAIILLALCPAGLSRGVKWFFALPVWHPFAQLIFPIYLFHFPFIVVGAALTFLSTDPDAVLNIKTYQVFVIYFWAVLLTTLFALVAHIFIEKPFLTIRHQKA